MRIETDRTASVIDENQQDGNEIPGLSSFANSISVGPSKHLFLSVSVMSIQLMYLWRPTDHTLEQR